MGSRRDYRAVRCRPRQLEGEAAHPFEAFIVRAGVDVQGLNRAVVVAVAGIVSAADVETHDFQLLLGPKYLYYF